MTRRVGFLARIGSSEKASKRARRPRKPEQRRPLPPSWRPAGEVIERVKSHNLSIDKVLDRYRAAKAQVQLKRWRDDTFLRWFDEALLAGELADATPIAGMPVVVRQPYAVVTAPPPVPMKRRARP